MQTYLMVLNFLNVCQLQFAEWASKIKSILSIIFHAIYMYEAVCIQFNYFSDDDCENTYNLSYYHH